MVNRFDIYLLNMDAAHSAGEARNTRPCVVVSPDELNRHVETAIVAPISSTRAPYPTRVEIEFLNGRRHVILDQIRTVETTRLVKKVGELDADARKKVLAVLAELFAE
ncbi:MAG: type II toxin-antitoxin system PemK/MazF family toxin [Pyrinomonadaceae bacterium]